MKVNITSVASRYLALIGTSKEVSKVRSLIESCPTVIPSVLPASKKAKVEVDNLDECSVLMMQFGSGFMGSL